MDDEKKQEAVDILHELADKFNGLERFRPEDPPSAKVSGRMVVRIAGVLPNKPQMIFGWAVGAISLLIALMLSSEPYQETSPVAPFVIGIVAIAWALGYQPKPR